MISREYIPWVIMGDFNALSCIEDRVGDVVRQAEITLMLECFILACNLTDVKATGRYFTWTNKQLMVNIGCFFGLIEWLQTQFGLISIIWLKWHSSLKEMLIIHQ